MKKLIITIILGTLSLFAYSQQNVNAKHLRVQDDARFYDSLYFKTDMSNVPFLQTGEALGWFLTTQKNTGRLSRTHLNIAKDSLGVVQLWDSTGNYTFPIDLTDSIGIATNTPDYQLDVAGNIGLDSAIYFQTTDSLTGLIMQDGYPIFHTYTTNINQPSVYIGRLVGNFHSTGNSNMVLGGGGSLNSNTTGYGNALVGYYSGSGNTTGYNNSMLGTNTLTINSTGDYNSVVGYNSFYIGTDPNKNCALGAFTGENNNADSSVFIGYMAGRNETRSQQLYIENSSSSSPLVYGSFLRDSLAVNGSLSADLDSVSSSFLVYFNPTTHLFTYDTIPAGGGGGGWVGTATSDLDMNDYNIHSVDTLLVEEDFQVLNQAYLDNGGSVAWGKNAGVSDDGTSNYNTFIGNSAGSLIATGTSNVFIGPFVGDASTNTNNAVGIGYNSLSASIQPHGTVAVGTYSGWGNNGDYNNIIGYWAGYTGDGSYNNYLGDYSGYSHSGSNSIFIGHKAGYDIGAGTYLVIGNDEDNGVWDNTFLRSGNGTYDLYIDNGDLTVAETIISLDSIYCTNNIEVDGDGNFNSRILTNSIYPVSGTDVIVTGNLEADSIFSANTGYALNAGFQGAGNPSDATTYYVGMMANLNLSETSADEQRVYFLNNGKITSATFLWNARTTAGTSEDISVYIRINNTTDYLIETIGDANAKKVFNNASLDIDVSVDDYFEIKIVTPTWSTDPQGVRFGGNVFVSTQK